MKKLIVLLTIVTLALCGCAGINSIFNSPAVDFVCNPTSEQQATATAMLTALDAAQAAGAIFIPALAIAKASAVLRTIQAGGCFLVAELKAAFEVVDAGNVAVAKMRMKVLESSVSLTPPEYAPLRVFVK